MKQKPASCPCVHRWATTPTVALRFLFFDGSLSLAHLRREEGGCESPIAHSSFSKDRARDLIFWRSYGIIKGRRFENTFFFSSVAYENMGFEKPVMQFMSWGLGLT